MNQPTDYFILPWQQALWVGLWTRVQEGNLPHALLFVGAEGIGKRHLADVLMRSLSCVNVSASGESCGNCHACHLIQTHTHPDCFVVTPEVSGQVIRVDAVRAIVDRVVTTPFHSKYKIIIIDPASSMNINAANALLKVLEEPPAKTVFILMCPSDGVIPATVMSRCQKVLFPLPDETIATQWLSQKSADFDAVKCLSASEGAPLKALHWQEAGIFSLQNDFYSDWSQAIARPAFAFEMASKWSSKPIKEKISIKLVLDWLFFWLRDQLRRQAIKGSVQTKWFDFYTQLQQTYAKVAAVPQLNRQLILEYLTLAGIQTCN